MEGENEQGTDRVFTTRDAVCRGRWYKPKMFRPQERIHDEDREALMLIYESGNVEILCPVCGRYQRY